MEKSKFAQPVSMVCNKEQFEQYLKKPLEKLGYEPYLLNISSYNPILIAHDDKIKCTSKNHLNSHIYGDWADGKGYFIDHFNPELFLAIAGMREGEDIHIGEWWVHNNIEFDASKFFTNGDIYKCASSSLSGTPKFINNEGDLDGYNISGVKKYFRKATLQDLIEKFGKKEDKTDGNYQVDKLRYAVQDISKSSKINVGEDDLPKDELARHLSLTNLIMGYCYNDFTKAHELYLKIGQELEKRLKAERKNLSAKQKEIKHVSFIK